MIAAVATMMSLAAGAQTMLPRSTPAAEGVEAKAITNFFDSLMTLDQTTMHHVMVLRHGKVIAEMHPAPFRQADVHTLYSESKTFTSLAVGLCVDDGLLRVTDRVINFFPGDVPDTISQNLADMTIRDLLTMTAGIKPDWNFRAVSLDWEKTFLAKWVAHKPGTKYQYDSMATYMLSAIVQRVTGKTVLQLLQNRLFDAMDIHDAQWELSPKGVCTGGWGLRISAESQVKMGQLLLQKGMWNGRQLISQNWVEEASKKQVQPYKDGTTAHEKSPGYGYQIWRSAWPGSFRADGAFGQYVMVLPNEDMVVLINGMGFKTPSELKYIWTQLMPGVKDGPIAANAKDQKQLDRFCATAALPVVKGKATPKSLIGKTITVGEGANKVSVTFDAAGQLHYTHADHSVTAANGKWLYETTAQQPHYSITPQDCFSGLKQEFTTAAEFGWNGKKLTIETYWVDFITEETIEITLLDDGNAHLYIKHNFDNKKPKINTTLPLK